MANAFKKAAVAKTPTKAKKDKHEFNDAELDGAIEQWIRAKATITQAEQDQAEAEAAILPRAEQERLGASLSSSSYHSTVVVNSKLSVSQSKRYKAISPDSIDGLNKIFGEDMGRFFRSKLSIKVKDSILANDELTQQLVNAIGEDNVSKYFDIVETTEATEAFNMERSTNPVVAEKARIAMEEGLVAPYKAAVKLA